VLPGQQAGPQRDQFVRSATDAGAVPSDDADIAYAPVTQLSRWIEQRKLSSERLTEIYLRRLERFDPKLRCVITLTREHALEQARKADKEIAAGKYSVGCKRFGGYRGHPDDVWSGILPGSNS
jgi:hypothetical protein